MGVPYIVVTLDSKVIEQVKLSQEVVTIGRASDNDIVINNLSVSRCHAMIYIHGGGVRIKDMGSGNGTYVNGNKVDETKLAVGDTILIGKHILKLEREKEQTQEDDNYNGHMGQSLSIPILRKSF